MERGDNSTLRVALMAETRWALSFGQTTGEPVYGLTVGPIAVVRQANQLTSGGSIVGPITLVPTKDLRMRKYK